MKEIENKRYGIFDKIDHPPRALRDYEISLDDYNDDAYSNSHAYPPFRRIRSSAYDSDAVYTNPMDALDVSRNKLKENSFCPANGCTAEEWYAEQNKKITILFVLAPKEDGAGFEFRYGLDVGMTGSLRQGKLIPEHWVLAEKTSSKYAISAGEFVFNEFNRLIEINNCGGDLIPGYDSLQFVLDALQQPENNDIQIEFPLKVVPYTGVCLIEEKVKNGCPTIEQAAFKNPNNSLAAEEDVADVAKNATEKDCKEKSSLCFSLFNTTANQGKDFSELNTQATDNTNPRSNRNL